jgi:hypothetical protein
MKKILNYLILFTFIILFIRCCFLFLLSNDSIEINKEIPLTSIQNVQYINKKIYVGLRDFNRINVYNEKGRYIKAIRTYNNSKSFWFKILDKNDNFSIIKPFHRDIDTNNYSQIDAEIKVNRNFPQEITVETDDKFIVVKNNVLFYLSFNLFFFWLMSGIFITIFFTINKIEFENLKIGFKNKNTLLLLIPFLKKVLFNSKTEK